MSYHNNHHHQSESIVSSSSSSTQAFQNSILLELEMILSTVKQIDQNLINSIQLLSDSPHHNDHPHYKELIQKNVIAINDILKMDGQSEYIEKYQEAKLQSIRNQDDDNDDAEELDDDDLLQQLENEEDDEISHKYREARMQQLSQEFKHLKQSIHDHEHEEDLGSVETITNERKIMEIVLNHEIVIIHFYQPNFEKFINIKAELAPFLVHKLNIKVLPFILIYKNSNELDRIVGFEKLGVTATSSATPSYQTFENYLYMKNIINRTSIKFGTLKNKGNRYDNDDDDEDDYYEDD
ncbi:thioredoxin-like protein [Scheffersomyces coipomensis]|uniref:thioredoxin-like protein n=1 Tax=Scheffersomyces coipomensis TaxID=1788519 RepID=UPI00315DEE45